MVRTQQRRFAVELTKVETKKINCAGTLVNFVTILTNCATKLTNLVATLTSAATTLTNCVAAETDWVRQLALVAAGAGSATGQGPIPPQNAGEIAQNKLRHGPNRLKEQEEKSPGARLLLVPGETVSPFFSIGTESSGCCLAVRRWQCGRVDPALRVSGPAFNATRGSPSPFACPYPGSLK